MNYVFLVEDSTSNLSVGSNSRLYLSLGHLRVSLLRNSLLKTLSFVFNSVHDNMAELLWHSRGVYFEHNDTLSFIV